MLCWLSGILRSLRPLRWCSVGVACRALLASPFTGVGSCVEHAMALFPSRIERLHGFKKLTTEMNQFVCSCAMASYSSDAFLRELLEDSRLALRKDELQESLLEEFSWLIGLPCVVWTLLAELCGMEGPRLRAKALHAAHISIQFIQVKAHMRDQRRCPRKTVA